MITEVNFYKVNCDGCNTPLLTGREDDVYRTKNDIKEEISRQNWRFVEDDDKPLVLCPSCRFKRISDPEVLELKEKMRIETEERLIGQDPILLKVQESINRSILLEFDEAKKNLSKLSDNNDLKQLLKGLKKENKNE